MNNEIDFLVEASVITASFTLIGYGESHANICPRTMFKVCVTVVQLHSRTTVVRQSYNSHFIIVFLTTSDRTVPSLSRSSLKNKQSSVETKLKQESSLSSEM